MIQFEKLKYWRRSKHSPLQYYRKAIETYTPVHKAYNLFTQSSIHLRRRQDFKKDTSKAFYDILIHQLQLARSAREKSRLEARGPHRLSTQQLDWAKHAAHIRLYVSLVETFSRYITPIHLLNTSHTLFEGRMPGRSLTTHASVHACIRMYIQHAYGEHTQEGGDRERKIKFAGEKALRWLFFVFALTKWNVLRVIWVAGSPID